MKALFFFLIGNLAALLYFSHLFFQLSGFRTRLKYPLFWTFPVRFFLLNALLGSFCFFYPPMTLYMVAGVLTGRATALYLGKRKGP
jgi:hypothetical protein